LAAVALVFRFRGPVWNAVSNVLTDWYAPRTEVPGAVQALDRARGPTVHLSYPDVREKTVEYGLVCRPAVGGHPTLRASVDALT
jgi:hypothetical protein